MSKERRQAEEIELKMMIVGLMPLDLGRLLVLAEKIAQKRNRTTG